MQLFATLTIALTVVLAVLICAAWDRINPAPEDVDIKIRFEWVKHDD